MTNEQFKKATEILTKIEYAKAILKRLSTTTNKFIRIDDISFVSFNPGAVKIPDDPREAQYFTSLSKFNDKVVEDFKATLKNEITELESMFTKL